MDVPDWEKPDMVTIEMKMEFKINFSSFSIQMVLPLVWSPNGRRYGETWS